MFSSSIFSSLQRLRTGSIYPPIEIIWASHPLWPNPPNHITPLEKIHISILDSSFNPPTLAHLALLNTPRPGHDGISDDYDAKLLLLSVRNADKQLKPGDATYVQRVEMMVDFTEDLGANSNTAVAIIDEPTFVGKSKLFRTFLKEKVHLMEVQLTFMMGFDTLERLFAPKYYESSEEKMFKALRGFFASPSSSNDEEPGDGSRVVYARRSSSSYPTPAPDSDSNLEEPVNSLAQTISTFFSSSALPSSCVLMIDIGEDVWSISSSEVRDGVRKESERSHPWREMVTERTRRYIVEHGLYK
ncbi:Nucleotidylyl transferase [Lentinula aciculospora]|uniref:Nucleotidylyl transferase n=1 Tax=Lentinula aciculospora TaxID=153920 RepID=A0A9W9DNH1_9AGAR|nr:Nucleotidylyl transferase [Lentinula aciculospora]